MSELAHNKPRHKKRSFTGLFSNSNFVCTNFSYENYCHTSKFSMLVVNIFRLTRKLPLNLYTSLSLLSEPVGLAKNNKFHKMI